MACFDPISRQLILSVICSFAFIVVSPLSTGAQQSATTAAAVAAVQDAVKTGFSLSASSTDDTRNISVEAALIPARIVKTVFGKEIANNYAVIALTISNRSSDQSFIVHSVFIDYSHWLLSGSSPYAQQSGNQLRAWQQQTSPNQIDSVETRIVRGELLDRQPWSTRNWVLRALQAVGSVASGFTFATTNTSWIQGIGVYNGQFIPAAQTFWPDPTIGQMNRISDFGFQVNKVIAKQSSDIVVAFFPIERFLTPDLKSIFISSPAAFMAPFAALTDPKVNHKLQRYIDFIFPPEQKQLDNLKAHLSEVISEGCKKFDPSNPAAAPGSLELACQTAELVNRLSLNVVRVTVGGTMTVDVNKVSPQITEVVIDQDKDGSAKWKKDDTVTGVIRGSFLGGGTPSISKPPNVGQVTAIAEGSSDTQLRFEIKLSQELPAGTTTLTFQVSKTSGSSTIPSATRDYTIQTIPQATPPKDPPRVESPPH